MLDIENKARQEHKRKYTMSSVYDPKQSPTHCVWPQQKFPYHWHPLHHASVSLRSILIKTLTLACIKTQAHGFKLQFSLKWRVETVPTTSGLDQKLTFPRRLFGKVLANTLSLDSKTTHTLCWDLSIPVDKERQGDAKVYPVVTRRQLCVRTGSNR